MILFHYFTRLFWARWIVLFFCAALIVVVFEFLSHDPAASPWSVLIKLPFSLHKIMPFVTFVTMLLFTWHLMHTREWDALTSTGYSPWQIMRVPLIWVSFLGLMDMYFMVPLGQRFFNPFSGNKTEISLVSKEWHIGKTPNGYLFFRNIGPKKHVIQLTNQSVFLRHIISSRMVCCGQELRCSNAWDIQADKTPVQNKEIRIQLAQKLTMSQIQDHPLLMSLAQVNQAIAHQSPPSLLLYSRRHYWWGHFFWSLALVPLAMAILVGPSTNRYRKMLLAGIGIVGCLTLYLIKEWLYAISIPLAHSWSPLLLWMPSIFTATFAWGIFFEKKEL
jgi:lipopolysaccharide export LptBFGC system permease protein LptF